MAMGQFDLMLLISHNGYLGPFLFLMYMVVVFFVMLNMVLAIINDAFAQVSA